MDNDKNQLVEKLKSSNNILVTVSRDPSVDQLAACIGFTLLLNKLGKHATAVFSGAVPSTIEFLEPDQTLEKTTDSLRDFIIALDKSKADKLRYKVEDDSVRIFITPYRTSISEADLEFSQGDFNVDLVVGLGVEKQEDLDEAITAHGRILHDATVASVTLAKEGSLGSITWRVVNASSLSELMVELSAGLGPNLLDGQIATALLTGIVAETKRFSNEKTSPLTMSLSAELMAAGANQQLVATKLEELPQAVVRPEPEPVLAINGEVEPTPDEIETPEPEQPSRDGTLEIDHLHDDSTSQVDAPPADSGVDSLNELTLPQVADIDSIPDGGAEPETAVQGPAPQPATDVPVPEIQSSTQRLMTDPPQLGGTLTANSTPEGFDPSTDPLTMLSTSDQQPLLNRDSAASIGLPAVDDSQQLPALDPPADPVQPLVEAADPIQPTVQEPILTGFTPPPPAWVPPSSGALDFGVTAPFDQAPSDEPVVDPEPVATTAEETDVADARNEVERAINSSSAPDTPEPIAALNAQPLVDSLHTMDLPAVDVPAPVAPPAAAPGFLDTLQQAIPQTPPFIPPSTDPVPWQPPALAEPFTPPPALEVPGVAPEAPLPNNVSVTDPTAPPAVPPPIPFRFGNTTEPPQTPSE